MRTASRPVAEAEEESATSCCPAALVSGSVGGWPSPTSLDGGPEAFAAAAFA